MRIFYFTTDFQKHELHLPADAMPEVNVGDNMREFAVSVKQNELTVRDPSGWGIHVQPVATNMIIVQVGG